MYVLDNYKEPEKYKNPEDMTIEERIEFLEGCMAQIMVKQAELSSLFNLMIKESGTFDNEPEILSKMEKENELNAKLIEDFEVSRFKNEIKDL